MSTVDELLNRQGAFEALREKLVDELGPQLIEHPELGEALMRRLDNYLESLAEQELEAPAPADSGLDSWSDSGKMRRRRSAQSRSPRLWPTTTTRSPPRGFWPWLISTISISTSASGSSGRS